MGDVQETALIPLAIHASETKRKNARITDRKAVEIIEQLGVYTKKYYKYASHEGVVYRTIMIDREVKQIVSQHPDAVCVNLGCGLDDRFTRVDNGKIRWFKIDLPDAIEVRRRVFANTERCKSVVSDVLAPEWTKQIPEAKETDVIATREKIVACREREYSFAGDLMNFAWMERIQEEPYNVNVSDGDSLFPAAFSCIFTVTIHRMCIQSKDELSIFLQPGSRHIGAMAERATELNQPLPINEVFRYIVSES